LPPTSTLFPYTTLFRSTDRPAPATEAGRTMSSQAQPNPFAARSRRARRRKITGHVMEGVATAAAILAVTVLAIVIGSVAKKGLPDRKSTRLNSSHDQIS